MHVTIRPPQPGDAEPLTRLIIKYLKETEGGSFLPTYNNAIGFLLMGLEGTSVGDPCFVAEVDETQNGGVTVQKRIVGYIIARGVSSNGFDVRESPCRGYGTYVLPSFRAKGLERGIAVKLLITAIHKAKERGYTSYQMIASTDAHSERGIRLLKRGGGKVTGTMLEVDLTKDWKFDE